MQLQLSSQNLWFFGQSPALSKWILVSTNSLALEALEGKEPEIKLREEEALKVKVKP